MKRKYFLKRLVAIAMVFTIAVSLLPLTESYAATKTVSMKVYDQVIKSGNTLYCAGAEGLYKVTLSKSGKVKSKKLLVKGETFGNYSYICGMKKYGNFIYYFSGTEGTVGYFKRVNISTKKQKTLLTENDEVGGVTVAIKNKKIYYKYDTGKRKVMNLNGTSKKNSKITPKMKYLKTNKKGYSVIMKEKKRGDGYLVTTYLKTPSGKKYKLGSHMAY